LTIDPLGCLGSDCHSARSPFVRWSLTTANEAALRCKQAGTIMGAMAAVWALALLPVSVISSIAVLAGNRVVLGAAEGPAFPVAVHAVYNWFADPYRAVPTSVVASGAAGA
jgi:hypothetical protein